MKMGFKSLFRANKILKKYGKEFNKILKPYRKDIEKLGGKAFTFAEAKADQIINTLKEKVDDFDIVMEEIGGLENLVLLLWSTEEETLDVLTLEAIISWCKENLPKDADKAVVLRLSPENFPDNQEEEYKQVYLTCFLDKNDDVIENSRMKYFYANSIDIRLEDSFGDKDMIVLK